MNDELILEIADSVYPGKGLARHDGMVIFIPGALPGERVKARVARRRKRYAEAVLVEVLEAAPSRQEPVCPLASVCPGCCYQDAAYPSEVLLKQGQFANMLRHHVGTSEDCILPPVSAPSPLEYRNKMVMHVQRREGEVPVVGYYGFDNRTVFDVPRCPLAVPAINDMLGQLRSRGADDFEELEIETVEFRYTEQDGAGLRMLDGQRRVRRLEGSELLTENTALGPMSVPFESFFQVNPAVATKVVERVQSVIRARQPECVVDLYCGVGIFAIAASVAEVRDVRGVDLDDRAIEVASANAAALGAKQARFVASRTAEGIDVVMRDVEPERTTVIVDPPRRGLDSETIATLAQLRPSTIIYVSCGPDTLVRDIAHLAKASYRVVETGLFDMFPRTGSFESVTALEVD